MGETISQYSSLVSNSELFSTVAHDLGEMLEFLSTQKTQLVDLSRALAELLKEASGSLPAVQAKIMELTFQLSTAVQDNQKTINAALNENAAQLSIAVQDSQKTINGALNENAAQLRDAILVKSSKLRNN